MFYFINHFLWSNYRRKCYECRFKNNAVNDTTASVDDTLFGENEGSILGDELPKNIVFGKTILDPNTLKSNEFEESGSDVIRTSLW